MKLVLGVEVGRSPGDFVLDGDPAPLPTKGVETTPQFFGPFLLWPNGWMHQDATWYGGRPPPMGLCVRWGPSDPLFPKRGRAPQFLAHVYCGQTAGWIKMPLGTDMNLGPTDVALDGVVAPL